MDNTELKRLIKWAHRDSNPEPTDYESAALTVELWAQKGDEIKIVELFT